MTSRKKYLLYIVVFLSISLNALVLYLDVIPYLSPKIKQKYFPAKTMQTIGDADSKTRLIMQHGIKTIAKNHSVMVWDEPSGFTSEVIKKIKSKNQTEFRLNHYPRAFLYYGLTEYAIAKGDDKSLFQIKNQFDKFISSNQNIKIVDQVPLSLAALNLYKVYNESKYLDFSESLFKFIEKQMDEDGLVSYRKGQSTVFPDTLGMIISFLLEYDFYTNSDTTSVARDQIEYFIKFGVNPKTYMPSHAVNKEKGVQTGSMNWGRGIGWYFIALAKYHKETGEYEAQYSGLVETLSKLKNSEDLWSQFPGSTDKFDASSTTMFIYGMAVNNPNIFSTQSILNRLNNYISDKGVVLETSGDTYGINNYSHTFGESELSQGMLLLILSKLEK